MDYTFGIVISGTMEDVEERVTAALGEEGFGILTRIDVQATFKAKLDIDSDPYVILGACNPPLAYRMIQADVEIGALLPCNVVLRQEAGGVAVRFMDPDVMVSVVDAQGVEAIAGEARERLSRVAAALT
ncbi:MAG: DUF302 domain-containing protein [Actinomycetota bacterium]|nr:DUF302 domain-containing protein [Chloroflexota bacterium]MDK1011406.1 DUF302 domain-containing protein [Actinomycetota bacterium]MDK1017114.1 DUF302 domain-containing protein [Actinomycetota bacterium]MDK1027077.1 DUF302 domain-containing protein [Actinomycetota bacterium]MDK1039449.1 DUF302 domain-containing protein [Actinomycetota bacterium]